MLVLPVIICQVALYLLSRCLVGMRRCACCSLFCVGTERSQFVVYFRVDIKLFREREREFNVSERQREIMCVTEREKNIL